MYQQGITPLTSGQTDYTINFSTAFPTVAPDLILTDVFNSNADDPQEFLEGSVITRTINGFTFSLIVAPPNGNYVLSWMASDGVAGAPVTSSGIPVTNFPIYNGTSLPDNTIFPVVIPNGPYKSAAVRWNKIKTLMAGTHQHTVADISDSGTIGRALTKTDSAIDARLVIDAARTDHTHLAEDIEDSNPIGRNIITAEDAAAVRTLLDVPANDHEHPAADISDSSIIGRSVLTASNVTIAQTALNVPDVDHTHSVADIDASVIGASLMSAASATAARSAISAANVIGWEIPSTALTTRDLLSSDFGSKFIVSSSVSYTIPSTANSVGCIGFYVEIDGYLSIVAELGVTLLDQRGQPITSALSLPAGIYILEGLGSAKFCLSGFSTTYQRNILLADNKTEFIAASQITIDDIPGITNEDIFTLLKATSPETINSITNTQKVVSVSSTNISSAFSGNPAGTFFTTTLSAININSIGSLMEDSQSFTVHNNGTSELVISPTSGISINGSTSKSVSIAPKSYLEFVKYGSNSLSCKYSEIPVLSDEYTAFVALHGNNSTAVVGDITKPFATVSYALSVLDAQEVRSIIVLPGEYAESKIKSNLDLSTTTHITFLPGTYVNITSGTDLFIHTYGSLFIKGGNFKVSSSGGCFAFLNGVNVSEFNADIDTLEVLGSSGGRAVLKATDVTEANYYKNILKAETINCGPVLLVDSDSSNFTVKVRNLTTGNSAIKIQSSRVNLNVSDGIYTCANTILDPTSTAYEFNLYLNNATVTQGLSGYVTNTYMIGMAADAGTFRINGSSSSIVPTHLDLSGTRLAVANADIGTLIISNVNLYGTVLLSGGSIILDSVFIKLPDDSLFLSIDTNDITERNLVVYGTCFTNKDFNVENISFSGGSIISNEDFVI